MSAARQGSWSDEVCKEKHRPMKWMQWVNTGLLATVLAVVGLGMESSSKLCDKANTALQRVEAGDTADAQRETRIKHLEEGFGKIDAKLDDMRKEQSGMSRDIGQIKGLLEKR